MGHAFNQTIMDALTRYHRMRGFNTLWLPGTDHAGIATQIVVERQLQDGGVVAPRPRAARTSSRSVWDWKAAVGRDHHAARCGAWATRVDWSREYFTMDDKLSTRRHRDLRAAVRARA
ncbi:MAG: class I tRNA ligase family protein [Comamonadaceae bacterium]|nr:class I tRNA ligase family protein [Comamonadaceae bacterium]